MRLEETLREMCRVAQHNAIVAVAMPTKDKNLEKHVARVHRERPSWLEDFKTWNLDDIIDAGEKIGMTPFWGSLHYEPTGYSSASIRLQDAERENRDLWMNSFQKDTRDEAWREIKKYWLQDLHEGPYRHKAYSSYALFRVI